MIIFKDLVQSTLPQQKYEQYILDDQEIDLIEKDFIDLNTQLQKSQNKLFDSTFRVTFNTQRVVCYYDPSENLQSNIEKIQASLVSMGGHTQFKWVNPRLDEKNKFQILKPIIKTATSMQSCFQSREGPLSPYRS